MIRQSLSLHVPATPPGPRSYPLIGCVPQLLSNPFQFLTDTARQYGGIVHLGTVGAQPLYLITEPDYVKYVLAENYRNYTKGSNFKNEEIEQTLGNGLVNSEGDFWRRQHRLIQPAFHQQKIKALVTIMTKTIARMLEDWCSIAKNEAFNVHPQMLQLAQTLIVKTLLSVEDEGEMTKLIEAWNTVFDFLSDRTWAFIKLPLSLPTVKNRRFRQAVHTVNTIVNRVIRERRQGGNDPDDILSMMLNARDQFGEGMSEQQLRDEVVTIFGAGFETSGTTLSWIWYLLSQHPQVERKLQAELTAVLGGRTPTFEDLASLKYTKMVVQEAMRLYPGVWINSRTNVADDEIGGYQIPARSLIVLSPFVTHRLPAFWDDPEDFVPERFSPERSTEHPHYAYFPFGGGPRKCLGDIFAMTEIQLTIAMVSQQFRLKLVPDHPIALKPMLTLHPRHGIVMTLEARG